MVGSIHIMGILNLTPDSFYAGSRVGSDAALQRIQDLFSEGADVVDLGACSTRPGSAQPSLEEEWARLEPALHAMMRFSRPFGPRNDSTVIPSETCPVIPSEASVSHAISIDTYRAEIVRRAYDVIGPFMVNDISAGQLDPEMLPTVGRLGLPYVAMHMRGTPETMQQFTDYDDVVAAVTAYFQEFSIKAEAEGIREWILDPGFGFSKTLAQNYQLLGRLEELAVLNRPILAGLSRKSMVHKIAGITPEEALPATQVVQFAALVRGATWLRVHDVAAAVATARLYSTM